MDKQERGQMRDGVWIDIDQSFLALRGGLTKQDEVVTHHSLHTCLFSTLPHKAIQVLQCHLNILTFDTVKLHEYDQSVTDSAVAEDQGGNHAVNSLHHCQALLQQSHIILRRNFLQSIFPYILHALHSNLEQLLQFFEPLFAKLALHSGSVDLTGCPDHHIEDGEDCLVNSTLLVHICPTQALTQDHGQQILQTPEVYKFLDNSHLLFGQCSCEGSSDDLQCSHRECIFSTNELQHNFIALHGVEDSTRLSHFLTGVVEQDGEAVEQVGEVLLLVVTGGCPGEVGPDGLQKHFHATQPMETYLRRDGVGEEDDQYITAHKLVVIHHLMRDVVIRQDAIGQIVQDLRLPHQWLNSLLPEFQQRLDQLQHLQGHFVLLYTALLVQLLQSSHQTVEQPVLHHPHAHPVVHLEDLIITWLLSDEVVQEGDALYVDV